jgi:hypothetical protein
VRAPFRLTMTLNPAPGAEERARVASELEILCDDNEAYFREMQAGGLEVPCCAGCAGVKYRPPSRSQHNRGDVRFYCASDLLRRGHGDCGSVAAFDAAASRVLEGLGARPLVIEGPWGRGSYHAIVQSQKGTHDPTEAMEAG